MNMKRDRIQNNRTKRSFEDKQAESACIHIKNSGDFCMKNEEDICFLRVSVVVGKSIAWRWGKVSVYAVHKGESAYRSRGSPSKMENSSAFIGDGEGGGRLKEEEKEKGNYREK
jgi:hypothetical protein